MKIAIYYYSGAGNTRYIARLLRKQFIEDGDSVIFTRIVKSTQFDLQCGDVDLLLVGFPVYDLSAPLMVQKFVATLPCSDVPIAFFCTRAMISVNAVLELKNIAMKSSGMVTVANLDLYMPGTDILGIGTIKNSRTEKIVKSLHSRNIDKKIKKFIARAKKKRPLAVWTKWYSYLAFLIPPKTRQKFHDQYTKFTSDFYCEHEACTQCMLCVKNCPQENIAFDGKISFGSSCDMCLRCLHHCPAECIQIGEMTKGKVRYNKVELL